MKLIFDSTSILIPYNSTLPCDLLSSKWAWKFKVVSLLKICVYGFWSAKHHHLSILANMANLWSVHPLHNHYTSPLHFFPPLNCLSPTLTLIQFICTPEIKFWWLTYKIIKLWVRISRGWSDSIDAHVHRCTPLLLIYNVNLPSLVTPWSSKIN